MEDTPTTETPSQAMHHEDEHGHSLTDLGHKLFEWRDYTPLPLIALLLFTAEPTVLSATIGLLLVVFGELLRIYSVAFIGSVSRTRSESTGPEVVSSGPYRFVRNPLYVGNFLIASGFAIFGGVSWVIVLSVGLTAFQYLAISKYEETLLLKKFGDAYRAYMEQTPPWVPTRVAGLKEWDSPPEVPKALLSEKRTLSAIALVLGALLLLGR